MKINSWIIYFASIVDPIKIFLCTLAMIAFFCCEFKLMICLVVLNIFIPSKKIIYGMAITNRLVSENISFLKEMGIETQQQLSDIIFNSIEKAMNEKDGQDG